MSLTISQSENITETNVAAEVVEKLYNLSQSQTPPTTLVGSISLNNPTYQDYVTSLTTDYPNLHITAPAYYVLFEDSVVQQICATNWGSNGNVTTAQLNSVTSIDNNSGFKANSSITKFNEFRYFTGLTSMGSQTFRDCSNLEEITVPSQIDRFQEGVFRWCTKLKTLGIQTFPYVTRIDYAAFYQCYELDGELNFPILNQVGKNNGQTSPFSSCRKIKKVSLGHITSVQQGSYYGERDRIWFYDCGELKIVDFGDSVDSYGGYIFDSCPNLEAVVFRSSTPPTTISYGGDYSLNTLFGPNTSIVYVPEDSTTHDVPSAWQSATAFSDLYSAGRLKTIENDYNESTILAS